MICKDCNNELDNINGLKFCPYCGTKILEEVESDIDYNYLQIDGEENNYQDKSDVKTKKIHDTLEMPAITEEDIKKYKKEKFFNSIIKPFTKMKLVIPVITIILVISVGVIGYIFLFANPVDERRIKEDLIGKIVTLPKGTSIEIKKGNIKNLSINSRNTSKSDKKDDIRAAVTINNGTVEVKTLLSIQYIYEGKNKWKMDNNIGLTGETLVKPLIAMDEKQLIEELKKSSINLWDTAKSLAGEDVKILRIGERTPDLQNFKEEVLVEVGVDNGLVAATGRLKCRLNFENETWNLTSVERNSTDDFVLALSPSFSQDKIIDIVKKEGLEETVTNSNVFGGKGFIVKDSFTKSITIGDKKFDAQKGTLTVNVKRENNAGEIKSVLSTDYIFSLSFNKIELSKKSKTIVDSVTIEDMSKDFIVATITNVEIEGGNMFFWFSDNHKITPSEAKTLKIDKITYKKGLMNVRYVYGSITYTDSKKEKSISFVAPYFLVYDSSKGYNWKLDRIVGEDSPNYKTYSQ